MYVTAICDNWLACLGAESPGARRHACASSSVSGEQAYIVSPSDQEHVLVDNHDAQALGLTGLINPHCIHG